MTAEQYDIVKRFLLMGNTARDIAKNFKIELGEVMAVENSASYKQYKESDGNPLGEFGKMFGL